jgi:hypothetical protein
MTTEQRQPGKQRLVLRSCLGVGLGALLFSCAAGVPRVASDLEAQVPPELQADYKSFTENCSKCHELDRPLRAHIDDVRHWDLYVAKMMRTAGSAISARESPKILRFLYWYTERKQRLESERAKEVRVPVSEKAPAPPPAAAPVAAPAAAPVPAAVTPENVDPNAGNPAPVHAPTQVNQGEGAP